jgi:hypothetical protein
MTEVCRTTTTINFETTVAQSTRIKLVVIDFLMATYIMIPGVFYGVFILMCGIVCM